MGHWENDFAKIDKEIVAKEEKYIKTFRKRMKKIREWLSENDDKIGKSGKPTTEAGRELPDADLKISVPGK